MDINPYSPVRAIRDRWGVECRVRVSTSIFGVLQLPMQAVSGESTRFLRSGISPGGREPLGGRENLLAPGRNPGFADVPPPAHALRPRVKLVSSPTLLQCLYFPCWLPHSQPYFLCSCSAMLRPSSRLVPPVHSQTGPVPYRCSLNISRCNEVNCIISYRLCPGAPIIQPLFVPIVCPLTVCRSRVLRAEDSWTRSHPIQVAGSALARPSDILISFRMRLTKHDRTPRIHINRIVGCVASRVAR